MLLQVTHGSWITHARCLSFAEEILAESGLPSQRIMVPDLQQIAISEFHNTLVVFCFLAGTDLNSYNTRHPPGQWSQPFHY